MANLCIHSGLLSLEFLDNPKLVTNPTDIVQKLFINARDDREQVYLYILEAIPICKDQLHFNEAYILVMINNLLPEAKSLEQLLRSVQALTKYCYPD